jgi:accessory Sec system glycosyltransferase GtfB
MGRFGSLDKGLLLIDYINEKSLLLCDSFKAAAFEGVTMVVMDDGFIDDDKVGLYRLFLKKEGRAINPRFFNQIEMNDFWQIEASAHFGEIFDKGKLRGRINYTDRYKGENRIVSSVHWFNDDKIIRMTDYYDIYGDLYSRGTYDQKGKMIHRTYYDTEGKK